MCIRERFAAVVFAPLVGSISGSDVARMLGDDVVAEERPVEGGRVVKMMFRDVGDTLVDDLICLLKACYISGALGVAAYGAFRVGDIYSDQRIISLVREDEDADTIRNYLITEEIRRREGLEHLVT